MMSLTLIVAVTRSAWKREVGLAAGASVVVPPEDAAEAVAAATGGRDYEHAEIRFDPSGTSRSLGMSVPVRVGML